MDKKIRELFSNPNFGLIGLDRFRQKLKKYHRLSQGTRENFKHTPRKRTVQKAQKK